MNKHVVVIGAGVAGLESAGRLSKAGIDVTLLEKEEKTGGHLTNWYKLFPDRRDSGEVKKYLDELSSDNNINLLTGSTVAELKRNKSQFQIITSKGKELMADAVIVATGFDLLKAPEKRNMVMVYMIML
jgi:heterodisulfide reductase subunit A